MYDLLIEDQVLASDNFVHIVFYYDHNFSKLLKAFVRKADAIDYQRYYSRTNFTKCYIETLELE